MFDQTCRNLLTFCSFRLQIQCFLPVFARERIARMMLKIRSQCSFSSRGTERFG